MDKETLARLGVESVVRISFNGGEMPNGHLYAHTMARGASLDDHNVLVGALKDRGFVTEENFLLTLTEKGKTFATLIIKSLDKAG